MYLAHIRQDGETQTVREHCRNTAEYSANTLRSIGLEHAAYLAGLLHDMGKTRDAFMQYLSDAISGNENVRRGSVNHTFAAVHFLLERWHCPTEELGYPEVTAELLAYAAGAHHGLFDCIDPRQNSGFFHRETKAEIGYEESLSNYLEECADLEELESLFQRSVQETSAFLDKLTQISENPDDEEANRETTFYIGLLARMLLSAVIEGDRRDTAIFMNGNSFPQWPEDMRPIWAGRLAFMEQRLGGFTHEKPIDLARQTISDTCAAFASQPGGVYRLNVPTGGGKTLASLRYALTHAQKWNKARIIFTSPLLSILDQNAEIIRRYVGDDALILEHHSNLAEPVDTSERLWDLELLIDTWESPIIITTLVQLLNTCFSGKTSAIRRFHSLCNSVIVIDEVQTVPGKMLTLFNLAVNFLSEVCGATVLLCSATQPELNAAQRPLRRKPAELVPYQKELWEPFKRTEIQDAGHLRLEEIPGFVSKALQDCCSLLVVCNTKEEAGFLFGKLSNDDCICFHLSAAMCIEHRRRVLHDLQTALADAARKVVCVSTQVIEAGVDISFQQVIRLCAGMDSIIQAAGRCNRHAEQDTPAPVRIVQCADEKLHYLEDITRGQAATTALLNAFRQHPQRFQNDLSSHEAIRFYYRQLYANMDPGFQDDIFPEYGSLYYLLADNPKFADSNCKQADRYFLRQAFHLAGTLFQVFDEDTTDILVPFGRGRILGNYLLDADQSYGPKDWESIGNWIREAKGYSVSVYHYQWEKLQQCGAVTSLFHDSIHILSDGFYDDAIGFSIRKGTSGFQEV